MIGQTLLRRYTIEALVGEGGMGLFYRARDRDGSVVGIKRMKADVLASAELLARFEREAKAHAMLTHPNIATLHAVGATDDGGLFFVMELVEGEGLADALQGGPLAPARALALALQVLSALSYAHQLGLVHRDLKADNVLLGRRHNGTERAKVIDFGLVKLLGDTFGGSLQGLTADGALFGTPQYMAPEQITGEGIDGRTDLYAFGVLLFLMLTGRVPFDDKQVTEIWRAHLQAEVPSIRSANPKLDDPELDAVVATLLAKRPQDRFHNARAVARALRAVAAHTT